MGRTISRFSRAAGPDGSRRPAGLAIVLALALLAPGAALAANAGVAEAGVALHGGWMRMLIAARPAAGYFTLQNTTGAAKLLTGASSPACGQLMLHQSLDSGGQESMVMVKQVDLPPHGTLRFAPGGYHLMCMHPAMQPGSAVPVTLRFADGGTLAANFAVKGATGQ